MALPNNPSRDDIYNELANSTYRGSGGANSLKDMDAYVFGGDGSNYSRDGFAEYGNPLIDNPISVSNVTDDSVDVTFTLLDNGGLNCTFVAEITEGVDGASSYQNIGGGSGQQQYTLTVTNLDPDQQYTIRVGVYNKFNNANWTYYSKTSSDSFQTDQDLPSGGGYDDRIPAVTIVTASTNSIGTSASVTWSYDSATNNNFDQLRGTAVAGTTEEGTSAVVETDESGSVSVDLGNADSITVRLERVDAGGSIYYGPSDTETNFSK